MSNRPPGLFPLLSAACALALAAPLSLAAPFLPPPDRTPPASVTTLAVAATSYGALSLTWTAVGDDGGGAGACTGAGTATSYDLRYSLTPPAGDVAAWFNAATQAAGEPAPSACGSIQRMCISGLATGATYYLALTVQDDARNVSGVSNVASGSAGAATGVMHVTDVAVSFTNAGGPRRRPIGFAQVADGFGAPVSCALVTGVFSGCHSETASGVTDETGLARMIAAQTTACWGQGSGAACCFTFTVTSVSHAGLTYDSGANLETSGAVRCDFFGPPCPLPAIGLCPADFNADGAADSQDFFDFVSALFNANPVADFNGDGAVNSQDFFDFLATFFVGC